MQARREREVVRPPVVAIAIALLAIVAGIATFAIGWRQSTQPHTSMLVIEPVHDGLPARR